MGCGFKGPPLEVLKRTTNAILDEVFAVEIEAAGGTISGNLLRASSSISSFRLEADVTDVSPNSVNVGALLF